MSIRGETFSGSAADSAYVTFGGLTDATLTNGFMMAVLGRTSVSRLGLLAGMVGGAAGSAQMFMVLDSALLFGQGDFSSGYGTSLNDGEWRWYAVTKAPGSKRYRWHTIVLSSLTASHGYSAGATNHADFTAVDAYTLGFSPGYSMGYDQTDFAAAALWNFDPSNDGANDAAVEAALTKAAVDLVTSGAVHIWLCKQSDIAAAGSIVDAVGGANETARQNIVTSADPVDFDFTLSTPPSTVDLTPAVMSLAAVAVTPTPQPVTVALSTAALTLAAVALSAAAQPVTVALTPAVMHLAAVPVAEPLIVEPGVLVAAGRSPTLTASGTSSTLVASGRP